MRHHGFRIHKAVTGLLVVAAGILLFLFNAGILNPDYQPVVFSWPMLLVAIGFNGLFSRHSWFFSVVLMLVGGFFLLQRLDIACLALFTQNGWTVVLVLAGLFIFFRAIFGHCACRKVRRKMEEHDWAKYNHQGKHKGEAGYIDLNYVFSGTKEKLEMEVFRGGEVNCVFGGVELDFSGCRLAEGVSTLEISSVFGGAVLYIPEDWNIEIRQNQVFGNFVDHRPKNNLEIDKSRTLIIKASSVFGGGEIKCQEQ